MATASAAGIRPVDRRRAERLSLRLSDFPSGWKTNAPPSTRLERVHCATAPKVEDRITGYSDSADFVPFDPETDKRSAASTARVFASVAAATRWYAWYGGEKSACDLNAALASWKKYCHGFKVSRPRHVRTALRAACSSCPAHDLSAWRWGFTISKPAQKDTTYVIDWVVVRTGRVVDSFSFSSVDRPFGPQAGRLVAKVLER